MLNHSILITIIWMDYRYNHKPHVHNCDTLVFVQWRRLRWIYTFLFLFTYFGGFLLGSVLNSPKLQLVSKIMRHHVKPATVWLRACREEINFLYGNKSEFMYALSNTDNYFLSGPLGLNEQTKIYIEALVGALLWNYFVCSGNEFFLDLTLPPKTKWQQARKQGGKWLPQIFNLPTPSMNYRHNNYLH